MAQIAWLKVPSNGGFIANYNDRNGMKEMEEKRMINEDENMISLKEKTETKMEEKEENKDKIKREAEGDYRA